MRLVMILFYLFLILIGVSFAALNAGSVTVNFYIATISLPVSVLMTLTLGVGLITGFLFFLFRSYRLKRELHKARQQLKIAEEEVKNLRNIPFDDSH